MSLTLHNAIYYIANNHDVQEALYKECAEASKEDDSTEQPMPYLRAIFKESHRVTTPTTDIIQVREYPGDLVLPLGYEVRAGTRVTMLSQWATRDPQLVPNVKEFLRPW